MASTELTNMLASYLARKRRRAVRPVCDWIEANVYDSSTVSLAGWDYSHARLLRLEEYQRRILSAVLTPDESGRFPYRTVVWSQIKKSGKTQIAGAVGAWWASEIEAPNLVLCLANDEEQSAGRIFSAMAPTVYKLTGDFPVGKTAKPEIRLPNGTVIKALPNNYAGEAGANYGLTLWSELWAYTSERSRRLFDELMPVPTRRNSVRWVETYAGFEDESDLLLEIFLKVFRDTSESSLTPRARRVTGLEDLPCYEVPDEGLFVFWDHERRMTWQQGEAGDRYYREMAASLRPSAYIRLCENRWQKSAGDFIPDDWYRRSLSLSGPTLNQMILAADASQRHDTTSLVGMRREGDRYRTCYVKVWNPHGRDIDLDETLTAEILALSEQGLIDELWYDPYQLHQIMLNLRKHGIEAKEFPQGEERVRADTFLWKLYRDGAIDNYPDPDLADHIRAAKAKEQENERLRIVKGTASNAGKVDAVVAQSMAAYKASLREDYGPPDVIDANAFIFGGRIEYADEPPTAARHAATREHRKWSMRNFCQQCYEAFRATE